MADKVELTAKLDNSTKLLVQTTGIIAVMANNPEIDKVSAQHINSALWAVEEMLQQLQCNHAQIETSILD